MLAMTAGALTLIFVELIDAVGAADRRRSADPARAAIRMQAGPYCGIYSLAGAASALGREISLADLISTRFVSSELGSSGWDLAVAAHAHSLAAEYATGLTDWDLLECKSPLILRISTAERRDVFNHWVAYLGVEDGKARVLNYPDPVMLYPFGELLSRWDGSAVIVALGAGNAAEVVRHSRMRGLVAILGVFAAVSLFAKYACHLARGSRLASGAVAIGLAATALAFCHDLARPGSLLRNARVAKVVAVADGAAALPTLTARELRDALDGDKEELPVLVDARLPRDYQRGHIPGAINIPAWATASSRQEAISAIPRSAHVVVYCQGPECSYDEDVAAQFVGAGFERVSLLPGGWPEWRTVAAPPRAEDGG
ncbi:MAG TPA: rhodanese-like domain-containing protein [Pirellulales bacterium]